MTLKIALARRKISNPVVIISTYIQLETLTGGKEWDDFSNDECKDPGNHYFLLAWVFSKSEKASPSWRFFIQRIRVHEPHPIRVCS
jgi:hypothetical protein